MLLNSEATDNLGERQMLERVVSGVVLVLLVFSLGANAQFGMWVTHVPDADQVQLYYWRGNCTSYMNVSITFCNSGYNVSDWGTPTIIGNDVSVNAEIWHWTGIVYPWCWTASNTYTLGNLTVGKYHFTFKVWEYHHVKNITFNIYVNSTVDFCPQVFILRSTGLLTAYMKLQQDYNLSAINTSTILLNGTIPFDTSTPFGVEDYGDDGISDLMMNFNRTEVTSYILANVDTTKLYKTKFVTITLTLTGYLNDDIPFQGSDTIGILLCVPSGINKYIVPS